MNKNVSNSSAIFPLIQPDANQRIDFLRKTAATLGVTFPEAYLERGEVLTLLDSQGTVSGGAIVVADSPFRSLESIPENRLEAIGQELGCLNKLAEVNGVWLAPHVRSPYSSFRFWRQLIEHLLSSEKDKFLFTFDNSNGRMKGNALWLKPKVLYSGATIMLPGMNSPADETIAMVERGTLVTIAAVLERRDSRPAKPKEAKFIDQIERRVRLKNTVSDGVEFEPDIAGSD